MKTVNKKEREALDKALYAHDDPHIDRATHYEDSTLSFVNGHQLFVVVNVLPPDRGSVDTIRPAKILIWNKKQEQDIVAFNITSDMTVGGYIEVLDVKKSGKGLFVLYRIHAYDYSNKALGEVVRTRICVFHLKKMMQIGLSKRQYLDDHSKHGLSLCGKLFVDQITPNRHLIRYVMRGRSKNWMFYMNKKDLQDGFVTFPATHIYGEITRIGHAYDRLFILCDDSYMYNCFVYQTNGGTVQLLLSMALPMRDLVFESRSVEIRDIFEYVKTI